MEGRKKMDRMKEEDEWKEEKGRCGGLERPDRVEKEEGWKRKHGWKEDGGIERR